MTHLEHVAARLDTATVRWLACLCLVLAGLASALPHLHEALWQDEAATLAFHAKRGMLWPFLHYGTPNNHVAFSSMLAGWRALLPADASTFSLRLLPLGLFLAAIPATFLAARRLGGGVCAIVATTLFAVSAVAGNFATQLRGYGACWLFSALVLLCAMNVNSERGKWLWRLGFAAFSLVAIAILPTNVYLVFAIGAGAALYNLPNPTRPGRDALAGIAVLVLAPPLALFLAYAPIWDELLLSSTIVGSQWTVPTLLWSWTQATLADYRWLLPWIAAGAAMGVAQVLRGSGTPRPCSRETLFALLLLLAPAAAAVAMPNTPFPRTLVPFLPVWYCALGFLACQGVRLASPRANRVLLFAALLLLALPLLSSSRELSCRPERAAAGAYDYDLCYQYFRDQYHPDRVMRAWSTLGRPDVPIATNFEGYHALRAIPSGADIFEYRYAAARNAPLPLIVAHDAAEMEVMATHLGMHAVRYVLFVDTGYFKIYAPSS